uniref:Mitochondrial carrier protein n=1 Tax=Romanomermis culicivorax TaxID=13658 RepID=A0A915IER6_ROMCU
IGGTAGAVVTCPLEVVKTRLQSSTTFNKSPPSPPSSGGSGCASTPLKVSDVPSTSRSPCQARPSDYQSAKKCSLVYSSGLKVDETVVVRSTKSPTATANNVNGLQVNAGGRRFASTFYGTANFYNGKNLYFLTKNIHFSTNNAGDFRHMSLLRHLKYIVENEGFWSLWRGLGPTLVGVAPSRAIYFCAYSNAKNRLNQVFVPETPAVHVCSATFAGKFLVYFLQSAELQYSFWSATMTNPVWLIRTRLQLDRSTGDKKLTVPKCIQTVFREKGLLGFYRGVTASYVGISETVIHFVIYEYLKSSITANSNGERKASHFLQYMLCAGISRLIATTSTYPHAKCGLLLIPSLRFSPSIANINILNQ